MKKFLAWVTVLVLLLWSCGVTMAGGVLRPLPLEARASMGATHVAEFSYADFTSTATNTAVTFTNAVAANSAVSLVAMVLDTAFSVGTTNYTDSLALKIGDGSDDDLFLASTELASDGSEVFVKYGPPNSTTLTTSTLTNVVYNSTTGNVTVATGAVTTGELGRKLYSTAGSIIYTFTPDTYQATGSFAAGIVRVYFKVFNTKEY